MATLRDVARHVGLSVATVSRALSGHPHVDEGTRRRVSAAAAEIGYQPNALARALRQRRTNAVGLIIPDILNDFYAECATVVQHELEKHGYRLILCISNSDPETDRGYLRTLVEHRVDAIVHVPCTPQGAHDLINAPRPIPIVELLRHTGQGRCDAVMTDDHEGAAALTRHLIALGHPKIAMITGSLSFSTTRDRVAGYRDALGQAGFPPSEARIVYGEYSRAFGYDAALQLMQAADPPTAIFSSGSPLTLGVLSALKELHLQIPGDVSLVCYEDPDWYAAQNPPLTCYALPLREMGLVAAQLLIERLAEDGGVAEPRVMRFPGKLIVRQSTTLPASAPAESSRSI
ncbi:MAG TPA: LacI family DNA-binding transcriptional regulator [Candidatus Binatia bacterium]|nr:LacI family DNA-binding transcriptional regulator [Candidatus Binatia bacterium]